MPARVPSIDGVTDCSFKLKTCLLLERLNDIMTASTLQLPMVFVTLVVCSVGKTFAKVRPGCGCSRIGFMWQWS